jgi:hypothetical protein
VAQYIVTVRQQRQPGHDPQNKKVGVCSYSNFCTDVTGEHHSYLFTGTEQGARDSATLINGARLTRLELVSE